MENCITKEELEKLIENDVKFKLIDVRSEEEFNELHIPIAANFSIETIDTEYSKLDKEILIVTTCGKGGGRSESASQKLKSLGFNTTFLCGGTFGWFEK